MKFKKVKVMVVSDFESDACKFHLLPDEILLKIFSCLKYDEVAQCARVSRRWNRISKDDSFKKIIDLSHRKMSPDEIDKFSVVHHSQKITDLRLREVDVNGSHRFLTLLTTHPGLRKLSLTYSNLIPTYSSMTYFSDPRFILKNLVHLSLRGSIFDNYIFTEKTGSSNSLPLLRCLDIGEASSSTDVDFLINIFRLGSLISIYMDHCSRIQSFYCYEYDSPNLESDLQIFDDGLGSSELNEICHIKVQVLDLEFTSIDSKSFTCLINCIECLKELYVGHTLIEDETFVDIPKIKKELPIRHLCIRNTAVTADAIFRFLSQTYNTCNITIYSSWDEQSMKVFQLCPNWKVINSPQYEDKKCYHYKDHKCI